MWPATLWPKRVSIRTSARGRSSAPCNAGSRIRYRCDCCSPSSSPARPSRWISRTVTSRSGSADPKSWWPPAEAPCASDLGAAKAAGHFGAGVPALPRLPAPDPPLRHVPLGRAQLLAAELRVALAFQQLVGSRLLAADRRRARVDPRAAPTAGSHAPHRRSRVPHGGADHLSDRARGGL